MSFPSQLEFLTANSVNGQIILYSNQAATANGNYQLIIQVDEKIGGGKVNIHLFHVSVIVEGVEEFEPDW